MKPSQRSRLTKEKGLVVPHRMLTVFLTGFWAIVIGLALFNVIRRRYRRRTTAGVPPPAEDSRAPSLVNPPPRRWVSLSLDELVFERDRASGKLVLVESATAPLLALCEAAELFIVAQVESDDDEKDIMATLESCGAFLAGLQKHRVMFGSTAAGRVSMVRQLQPFAHLEGNPAAVAQLKDKVSNVVRVHRESAADTTEAFTLSQAVDVMKAVLVPRGSRRKESSAKPAA